MRKLPQKFIFYGTTLLLDVAVVVLLFGFATGWWVQRNADVAIASAFSFSPSARKSVKSGIPTKLSIPSLQLTLPVQLGIFNPDGSWTLDDHSAFYATPSVPVNDSKGTTLLYGHNTKQVFANLKNLQPGAELIITTDSGFTFTYAYSFVSDVTPEDISIFNASNAVNVTLQTCSGPWDQLRSMYTFNFKTVVKS